MLSAWWELNISDEIARVAKTGRAIDEETFDDALDDVTTLADSKSVALLKYRDTLFMNSLLKIMLLTAPKSS